MSDYSSISFKNNGKLKLLIIVGTRPEIIRLAAVINKTRKYFDVILAHTGQNYDYNLNGVFFHDLQLADPEVYMNAVGADLGETMGNIISESYKLMAAIQPDAVLVLGDTNSCLSVIGAKRLHIPIFHMEAGNRCKDECLPEETNRRIVDIISDVNMAYSEHARRYLADTGLPKERTYVTGSPMAEVLHQNLEKIEASDIHQHLGLEKGKYILLSAHREENIDTEKNFTSLFTAINKMAEKYDMPILYSCHPRSRKRLEQSGFKLDKRVIQHEPLGFHDYNCLQMNAFCVEHPDIAGGIANGTRGAAPTAKPNDGSAAASGSGATSAIPQTSDNFPYEVLSILACMAVGGFIVALYLKKRRGNH